MSERGSFVTSYIYCEKCLQAAIKHLISNPAANNPICASQLPSWERGAEFPIIAGRLGSMVAGGEIGVMLEVAEGMVGDLCHDMAITVLAESGSTAVITIRPNCEFPKSITTHLLDRTGI